MSAELRLWHEANRYVEVATAGGVLFRYVYAPATPSNEAPRPYAHPVCSLAGDVLTNFRPNDHPWHHGLSLTVTRVNDVNFWGGPSYRRADGYQWRGDHGEQRHQRWQKLTPERLEEIVEWRDPHTSVVLLHETRVMQTAADAKGWSLRWTSELRNATGSDLVLGNYHASEGLGGSHYTGLQFRGARDLLDDHGDSLISINADGGLRGEQAVHGSNAAWMEWSCQHDGTLHRTRIRFENLTGPLPWFVRAKNPVAAFAFHQDSPQRLAAGAMLQLDHRLTFTSA